jgi:dCMP deaminase
MPSGDIWNKHWINVAFVTSELSKDPSTKVGACLVTQDNRQCSIGFNGFASGVRETKEEWENRDYKINSVIHAEENALLLCPFEKKGSKLYVTHQPCHRCIIRILQCGIKQLYYSLDYPRLEHKDIWDKHAKMFDIIMQIERK